jgi:hypothetical protein
VSPQHAADGSQFSAVGVFIHSASCGAPIRQDCIETSAKSEVVTVCSGEERLQSTAIILIMTRDPGSCHENWNRRPYDLTVPCLAAR